MLGALSDLMDACTFASFGARLDSFCRRLLRDDADFSAGCPVREYCSFFVRFALTLAQ
jgi:hypothetical protein